MIMKIGLYGGTFDPIHHGHLILAREALETLGLKKVIFLPAQVSPFKVSSSPAPPELRLSLLKAALEGEPYFTWDTCELEREGPSYTIDTIRLMRDRYPQALFYYFIGEDHLSTLPAWKEYDALTLEVRFVVLNRGTVRSATSFPVIDRRVDISATDIRDRIARGLSVRYFLPEAVLEILLKSDCYRTPRT
jgi:nicotinate-nucleotide adenylyltransferase